MHQNEVFAVQPEYRDHALVSVVFVLEGRRTVHNMYIQQSSTFVLQQGHLKCMQAVFVRLMSSQRESTSVWTLLDLLLCVTCAGVPKLCLDVWTEG